MGGCFSVEELDYGAIAAAKEAKHVQQYRQQNLAHGEPSVKHKEPTVGFNPINFVDQANEVAKKSIQAFADGPKLAEQVSAGASVVTKKVTKGAHHLKNVFATPLTGLSSFRPPVFPKAEEEQVYIAQALKHNFVFSALSERELKTIIDAFERIEVVPGDAVITQGEEGDYFYVIREGNLHYEVDGKTVGHARKGQSFGELALLYTSPRAATVIADGGCVLYRVDQKSFRYIMQSQTVQTENDKKELLQGVSFLQDLDPSDIDKLIHALTPRKFEAGEYIVRKGEEGETFYIIQEGKVRVSDISIGMTDYEDQVLGVGEYFGERALVTKEPRSANVIGRTKGILLAIDRETFETLVGNLSQLVLKTHDKRNLVSLSDWSVAQMQSSITQLLFVAAHSPLSK
jgi:cAMP-dependent protein kinase regulator